MDDIARWSAPDRAALFAASAAARGFTATVIEKDFWVCWTLKRLFTLPEPPAGLIFKGGTSLSKVWGVIDRFSEDVDLSFNRGDLGFQGETDPASATSTKQRDRQLDNLNSACTALIHDKFLPQLNAVFAQALGADPSPAWRLEIDETDPQSILFHYPASGPAGAEGPPAYLRPFVKLELGARGEHWPSETKEIQPFAAEDFPKSFQEPRCTVKVVAAKRTFWEKATILHSWYHAGPQRTLRDRQSRHYYDVYQMAGTSIGQEALADLDLLRSVGQHKSVFFAADWAKYQEAVPGTLRLVPPDDRVPELEKDYAVMRTEMIFGDCPR